MWLQQIIDHLLGEATVIAQVPLAFAACILVGLAILWLILNWRYGGVIAHKNAEIASLLTMVRLRDDQLNDKFHTTPPDEARQLIGALQAQLDQLTPRRIPKEKLAALGSLVRPPNGESWTVDISWEATASDSERIAYDFSSLFDSTGWIVQQSREFGSDIKPGITLTLGDPESAADRVVREALKETGLTFRVDQRPRNNVPHIEIGHPWD